MRKTIFFWYLGVLEKVIEAFFGDVGSKMPFFGHLESTCGTCWRQDGQQDGQDGQHEGQDGRKEAKRGRYRSSKEFDRREPWVLGPLKRLKSRNT